jgi:hypothetical protein
VDIVYALYLDIKNSASFSHYLDMFVLSLLPVTALTKLTYVSLQRRRSAFCEKVNIL